MIDKDDLRAFCHEFQLDLSEVVLDHLMDVCDADRDGLISFVEFANFLNWKDSLPISSQDQRVLMGGQFNSINPAGMTRTVCG